MKTRNILFFLLFLFIIPGNLFAQDGINQVEGAEAERLEQKKASPTMALVSYAGDTVNQAKVGDKLKLLVRNYTGSDPLYIYANNFPLATLRKLKNEKDWYVFEIRAVDSNKDTLSEIINPDKKARITLNLYAGTKWDDKHLVAKDFILIFDSNINQRKTFSGITGAILLMLIVYVMTKDNSRILRDHGTGKTLPPFSLARTQMAFWTLIILIAFVVVWWNTGNIVSITGQVLGLLGISAATTVTASIFDNDDISNPKIIKRHQEDNSSKKFFLNILSDSKGLSIHRFQNVAFTLAIGCYFIYEVFSNFKIPELNKELMVLMGISSGTYLAIKKGENKNVAPDEPEKPDNSQA